MDDLGEIDGGGILLESVHPHLRDQMLSIGRENVVCPGDELEFAELALRIFDACEMLDAADMLAQKYPSKDPKGSPLDVLLEALTRFNTSNSVKSMYNAMMEYCI